MIIQGSPEILQGPRGLNGSYGFDGFDGTYSSIYDDLTVAQALFAVQEAGFSQADALIGLERYGITGAAASSAIAAGWASETNSIQQQAQTKALAIEMQATATARANDTTDAYAVADRLQYKADVAEENLAVVVETLKFDPSAAAAAKVTAAVKAADQAQAVADAAAVKALATDKSAADAAQKAAAAAIAASAADAIAKAKVLEAKRVADEKIKQNVFVDETKYDFTPLPATLTTTAQSGISPMLILAAAAAAFFIGG
jgi:hypothetical protein